ncbi:MAG TPA: response regulator transcription factor [Lachnospiraceae bacterium]|nr:response regulator transcription factor [Lachnospiraceae bacterium]
MTQLLVVEDDNDIAKMLKELLRMAGYSVDNAYSGTEALLCLERKPYDLMLLDLMLPGLSGEEVLEQVRKDRQLPIIAVSAKDDKNSKITMLKNGADDYITKPFDMEELLVRIEVVLRRKIDVGNEQQRNILTFKDIELDESSLSVTVKGNPITLTKYEYGLLRLLMSNPKKVFTKNNIYESVWDETFLGEDNAVNVHICNLRSKLARVNPNEKYIQTVWGIGFKMQVD